MGKVFFHSIPFEIDKFTKIHAGKVEFTGIGGVDPYEFDTFITILGTNVNLENLQFSGFYYGRGPQECMLINIVLSEENENESANIFYNFTDISINNCARDIITTSTNTSTSTANNYFGTIYFNNFAVRDSNVDSVLVSAIELEVNGLTISNTSSQFDPLFAISITQQVVPVGESEN